MHVKVVVLNAIQNENQSDDAIVPEVQLIERPPHLCPGGDGCQPGGTPCW